ncbi:hypothetical protein ACFQ88_22345 [Paenibacillus sp. NPDC056579]|uniref:hypothetical protein n=1 Tax=Paenibacillus sp. NPDC056579 TaxID=3345871 RepID=UPI003696FEAE
MYEKIMRTKYQIYEPSTGLLHAEHCGQLGDVNREEAIKMTTKLVNAYKLKILVIGIHQVSGDFVEAIPVDSTLVDRVENNSIS